MATHGKPKKKIALTIYLLKPNPEKGSDGRWTEKEFLAKPVDSSGKAKRIGTDTFPVGSEGEIGILYVRKPHSESVPEWVDFVRGSLPEPTSLDKLKNKSVSALLVVTAQARQFVLAFGHGRYMLDQKCVEDRFGIRVVLNSISPDKIASIDRQTFDASPRISRTQTVKASSLSDYGISAEQDLLRALVGFTKKAFSSRLGEVLAGMDSLKTTVAIDLMDLGDLLKTALERSESKDYLATDPSGTRSEFAWVDNLKPVNDKALIESLEKLLWKEISSGGLSEVWLAIPEVVDWADITGFAYSKKQLQSDEVLDTYLDIHRLKESLRTDATIDTLKHRDIFMVMSTGAPPKPFPAFKCIYAEITHTGNLYILNAGRWFHVEPNFQLEVQKYFNDLPRKKFAPPFVEYAHKGEGDYNEDVSKRSPSTHAMLDRKLIRHGGKHDKIEVCDLFFKAAPGALGGELIHVKRGRSSATLSHLFAQGLVSSALLVREPTFVAEVNKQLVKQSFLTLPLSFSAAGYEVVYAIIDGASTSVLDLPFFSKVNLQNCAKSIAAYGFKVCILHIPESAAHLSKVSAAKHTKKATIAGKTKKPRSVGARRISASAGRAKVIPI